MQLIAINTEWEWHHGRQKGKYEIFNVMQVTLFGKYAFDILLLKYKKGAFIPQHRDPEVAVRFNFELVSPEKGGVFKTDKKHLKIGRLRIFRPDKHVHWVTKIQKGSRLVLAISFGNGKEIQYSKHQKRENERIKKDFSEFMRWKIKRDKLKELDLPFVTVVDDNKAAGE